MRGDGQWNLFTLKAYFDEQLLTRDKALELQATEYERRLNDLNHENARVALTIKNTVSADKYASDQTSFLEFKEKVNRALDDGAGRSKALPYIISIAAVLISGIMTVFWIFKP